MEGTAKKTRTPSQQRSIEKKNKIIAAAKVLFNDNGYHGVTTYDIAREAGVSIGSLYSYFADKKDVFIEVINQCDHEYINMFTSMTEKIDILNPDKRTLISEVIDALFKSLNFYGNLFVEYLTNVNPASSLALSHHDESCVIRNTIYRFLDHVFTILDTEIKVKDRQAGIFMIFNIGHAVSEAIVLKATELDAEALKSELVELIYKYVFL